MGQYRIRIELEYRSDPSFIRSEHTDCIEVDRFESSDHLTACLVYGHAIEAVLCELKRLEGAR